MSTNGPGEFWLQLFANPEGEKREVVKARGLRKNQRWFFLLPDDGKAAAACLDLYPAQTFKARCLKTGLRCLLSLGLPLGTTPVEFPVAGRDAFVEFLARLSGSADGGAPMFGVMAGNPQTDGQRFVVVIFGEQRTRVAVAKVGLGPSAQRLIEKEQEFLSSMGGGMPGVPRLRASFEDAGRRALALDFYPGASPNPDSEAMMAALLTGWIHKDRRVRLAELPTWRRLEQACAARSMFQLLKADLGQEFVAAVIQHGDFAPWNIRVQSGGEWMALDWERGEQLGVPGWDWFHFVFQTELLVKHRRPAQLVERLQHLISSDQFRQYATRTGIAGFELSLLLAYLLYMTEVIRPSEGLEETQQVLNLMGKAKF